MSKNEKREEKRICKNGIPLYYYTNPAQHSFFISLFIKAGNMYEGEDECGITHFFEHVAIRNVNKLTDGRLYNILDSYGLEFNASTFGEMIQFYISGAKEHFCHGAEFILKLLSPIALTREEIDAERLRIKAEIRESDDKNSLSTFSLAKVYEGTALAGSIVGRNKTLDKITLKRLSSYREKILCPENLFFYITGAASEHSLELLSDMSAAYPLFEASEVHDTVAPVPKKFFMRDSKIYIKNADYTMLRFGFDLDMSRVGSECCDLLYDILLTGYNSKLFIELSEKRGLFYDTSGGVDRYKNIGSFYFSFEVKENKLLEAVRLTFMILSSMKRDLLSEEECMRAGFVDNAMMLYDDARELNFTFAYDNHILDIGYASLEERREAYAKITPEIIREAADIIFRKENLTLTVKGKKRKIPEGEIISLIKEYL